MIVKTMRYAVDSEVRNQMVRFGYYNEDGHEIVSEWCRLHEGAKEDLLSIQHPAQMSDFIYGVLNRWQRGGINGETLADIRANIRTPKVQVKRKRQQEDLMRGMMQGRIPRRF